MPVELKRFEVDDRVVCNANANDRNHPGTVQDVRHSAAHGFVYIVAFDHLTEARSMRHAELSPAPAGPRPARSAAEWPTREQMEHVQRLALEGTVEVRRYGGDMMAAKVGGELPLIFDVNGNDVTERERVPSEAAGIGLPVDLVRRLLGDQRVEELLDEAVAATYPDYRLGSAVQEMVIAAVGDLLDRRDRLDEAVDHLKGIHDREETDPRDWAQAAEMVFGAAL